MSSGGQKLNFTLRWENRARKRDQKKKKNPSVIENFFSYTSPLCLKHFCNFQGKRQCPFLFCVQTALPTQHCGQLLTAMSFALVRHTQPVCYLPVPRAFSPSWLIRTTLIFASLSPSPASEMRKEVWGAGSFWGKRPLWLREEHHLR